MKLKVALGLCILIAGNALAQKNWLVTPEEMIESNKSKSQFAPKVVAEPNAPKIDLLAPKLDSSVSSPTKIELRFLPKPPATIKPDTFKVYYGTFQINITDRITKVAKVSPQGIDVQEANLPKGNHKLTLNVEDSEGRLGSRAIEFEIK